MKKRRYTLCTLYISYILVRTLYLCSTVFTRHTYVHMPTISTTQNKNTIIGLFIYYFVYWISKVSELYCTRIHLEIFLEFDFDCGWRLNSNITCRHVYYIACNLCGVSWGRILAAPAASSSFTVIIIISHSIRPQWSSTLYSYY
jgi:hypothetical protein